MSFDCFKALVVRLAFHGRSRPPCDPLNTRTHYRSYPVACRADRRKPCRRRSRTPPPPLQEAYQAQAAGVPDDVEFPDLGWTGWQAIAEKLNLSFLDPADAPLFRCAPIVAPLPAPTTACSCWMAVRTTGSRSAPPACCTRPVGRALRSRLQWRPTRRTWRATACGLARWSSGC